MSTYGSLPTSTLDQTRPETTASWRKSLGEYLESEKLHWTILGLTMLDAACVLLQILYTFFHECQTEPLSIYLLAKPISEWWLISFEMAEITSITITCVFLLECILAFVAFGPRYYSPGTEHWKLHIFDVVVVVSTFILDIVLRGKEREVAGLLIIFRLWRIVKVMDAVVKGLSYNNEEEVEALTEELETERQKCAIMEKQLADERRANEELRRQLSG